MEPKFEGDSNHYNFPSEPSLGGNQKQRDIPKIVPADLKKLPEDFKLPTASVRPGEPAPAAQPPQERPKDPKALMASLSKDISELSAPLKKEETPKETKSETKPAPDPIEKFGVKGSDGVILPPEDDLGDPTDPSRTPGIVRSIMLFICLCFVILAAWQVTLFLQPEILKKEPRGVLSVQGEDGYPYGMPMTHWYNEKDGKIYFHGAKSGHKIDAIKNCDKVSFCVMDEGYRKEGEWALNIRSVIVFGRLRIVEEPEKVVEICTNLCKKFTDDKAYVEHELKHSGPAVLCLELEPEHMTGKLVNES